MPRIRKIQVSVGFHPQTHRELSELAEELQMTINEIVRECVENDLSKFKARHKKRRKRRG